MKKSSVIALFMLVILIVTAIPSVAVSELPRVVDSAALLSSYEERALISKLDEISERQRLDVVVVTVSTLDGKTPMEYADDFYDYNGYGFGNSKDGILLLISMEDRDWWITTTGYGITAFTDAGIEYISDMFLSDLSDGYYADAFDIFASQCDKFITQARTGDPFDIHNLPEEPFDPVFTLVIAIIVGLVFALIVTGIMRLQLKSVRFKPAAADYVKQGSMNITESRDLFLYRNVNRRLKPKSNSSGGSSTHTSFSGRSHGGGGGKF